MHTLPDEMRRGPDEIFHYQINPTGDIRIYPFSASPDVAEYARFTRDNLPGMVPQILLQYKENCFFLRQCLHMIPTPENEAQCLDRMNSTLPKRIADNLTNIAVGRHYDVYRIAAFVVKIERYYGTVMYPSFKLWEHRWMDMEDMLSQTQKSIYQNIRNTKNAHRAVFRSITTQEFYNNTLQTQLPAEAYAPTTFALLQVTDILLDIQIQPWKQGQTLFNMLRRHNRLHRILVGEPYYSLKPKYAQLKNILKNELQKFLDFDHIDPHPANFILEDESRKLVLVDIQQFSPVHAVRNKELLQGVWRSW